MTDEPIDVALRCDDQYGQFAAVTVNGYDVLHLVPSARTAACAEAVVDVLRFAPPGALAATLFCANEDAALKGRHNANIRSIEDV